MKWFNFPPNADIWHLRTHWPEEKQRLLDQLQQGQFLFSPLEVIKTARGERVHL